MIRTAQTEYGMVQGLPAADPRITAFKGIPFAAPTSGENRWRAPQPADQWEGIRQCYGFGPLSMQPVPGLGDNVYTREWHVDPETPMSEDSLQLNVWTPARTAEEKLPVFVWFFGGGYQCGYPSEMEFDGERIARRGIVVVSVNYRLGCFGFLAHPALTKEASEAPTNFGLLDQQAGLFWVQKNIAAFGGDPGNVTIGGQSAGGGSVLHQLANRKNQGLFSKALIMSAFIVDPYSDHNFSRPFPFEKAQENGEAFFRMLGVATLEEARQLDAEFVQHTYEKFMNEYGPMVPTQDEVFVDCNPIQAYMEGKTLPVTVMAGNTEDEFLNSLVVAEGGTLEEKAEAVFGSRAKEFLSFREAHVEREMRHYGTVSGIELSIKKACLTRGEISAEQSPEPSLGLCYYYRFAPDMPGWDHAGTFHSSDLWFFFETLAKCWRPFTGRHYDLARQMCNYLCNFIRTGDPNGCDQDGSFLPRWDAFTKEHPEEMQFLGTGAAAREKAPTEFEKFLMESL